MKRNKRQTSLSVK